MSLVRDAVRGTRYRPLPGEHVVAARAVKDAARSAAGALMATHTAEDISTGHVDLAAVAAAASGTFAPRTTLTPDDIAAALIEQGISFSPPLGPGPPIRPYAGYNAPIRTWPYTPGTNIASETRTGRIPFSTLTQIVEGYDIAQICVQPGTEVITRRGLVPVEKVAVGDVVLTHKGRWRRVTETTANPVGSRSIYEVRASGLEPLVATGEHPVYAVRYTHTQRTHARVAESVEFVPAGELRPKGTGKAMAWRYDAATLPVMGYDEADEWLDLAPLLGEGFAVADGTVRRTGVGSGRAYAVPARVRLGAELGRLLGWYLAEGSIGGGRAVTFSLGPNEHHYAEQIVADAEAVFGLEAFIHRTPTDNGWTVKIGSSAVARLFACGTARTKCVPDWAWRGGFEFMRAMLDGWTLGDGCVCRHGGWAPRTTVITTSKTLAWQMRLVAVSLGLKASIAEQWHPGQTSTLRDGHVIKSGPVHYTVGWREKPQRTGTWSFEDHGRVIASAVKTVEAVAYDGLVYNLEVEQDESYVTTAGTVHNCISHIIASMTSMPLLFRAIDGYEGDVSKEIAQAKQFWKKPDGKHPWKVWLTKLVYQQCAYDCAMVYKVKDQGGRLKAVQVPDGRMWAPVVDYWGERPDAPGPAFVQFVQGLPWGWTDETLIVYEPFTARAEDPRYGLSPIECVLLNANTDVRFQFYFLQMFTGGQIPEGFAEAPPDQSDPDALAAWQELWDNFMTGDQSARWGMRWLPFGAKFTPYKPQNFDVAFSEHLERRTIAMFHRTPQDLGILADVNRATSETQVDQQFRISDLPRTSFIEDVFLNPITQEELGLPIECFFDTGQEKEDRLMVMQEQVGYIKAGVISPDDVREKILGLSVDPDKRIPRFYDAGGRLGVTPLGYIEAISKWFSDWDPTTGAPDLDKIQPREFIVPGELQAPPAGGPTPGARGQLPPGQPGGQAPGQNPPPVAPAPAPTSGGAKPAAGQEPAHDETNVAPAAGSKAPPGTKPAAKQLEQLDVGGLVVKAADSGRVLMIQRALQPGDPAAGTFEFPGGHMEGGETAMQAAVREWQEEVGVPLPDGYFDGSWTSPNGIYRGFVYVIASEDLVHLNPDPENRGVLNPDDPDQDLIEVVCWLDPAELPSMPNLRDECHTSDWVVIAQAGKLAKCDAGPTAGITAETGLQGVNLTGFNDDDEDEADAEEALQKALSQWRTNALLALRFGRTPKYFTDACIPVELGHRIYKSLAKMKTKEQVQTFFKAVKADPKGSRWQGSGLRRRIPEAYAPKIAQALREGTKGIDAAVASMVTRASKASPATPTPSGPSAAGDARAAVEANVSIDATRANAVFAQMYADAYAGGTKAARDALGVDARAPSWLSDDMLTSVSRDWETWTPGWGDAALKDAGGGLKTLLDARGITIQGISDSAMDRIGTALADGIAAGDPPATIASAMSDVIADPDRAFMVADTETARAMTSASIDTYQENGVEQVDLLTFEPCDECEEIEDGNPYPIDDAPDVPIHPSCRCALAASGIPGAPSAEEGE